MRVVRYASNAHRGFVFKELDRVALSSPRAISSGMLRRPPINLNRQSEDATILLIREVLQSGLELSEVLLRVALSHRSILIPFKGVR